MAEKCGHQSIVHLKHRYRRINMVDCEREMSLKEAAYQYGEYHSAARSYELIEQLVQDLYNCKWWEFTLKADLIDELKREIDWINSIR